MKAIFLSLAFIFFTKPCEGQDYNQKIDSFLNFYFEILENDVSKKYIPQNYPQYFDSLGIIGDSVVYINKYFLPALNFMEKMTCIKAPLSIKYGTSKKVDTILIGQWRNWFIINRGCLRWNENNKKPVLMTK